MKNLIYSALMLLMYLVFPSMSYAVEPPPVPQIEQLNDVLLIWDDADKRENGGVLLPADIRGYLLVYGLTSDSGIVEPIELNRVNEYPINNLAPGEYSFFIATVDTGGLQSVWAETITTIGSQFRPSPPGGFSASVNKDVVGAVNAVISCMTSNRCVTTIKLKHAELDKS